MLEMRDETRSMLLGVSTATLTSQLLKRGFRNTFIRGLTPLRPDLKMVGTAFTLRYVPAREDLDVNVDFDNDKNIQRLAVETIDDGEVLVIDARQNLSAASFGHIIATRIAQRGAVGLVTDGALRDSHRFPLVEMACYCGGVHAATSAVIHHPADMNVPIGCGGVMVMPGDVMVGDEEGVVAIPAAICDEVAAAALAQERLEELILDRVQAGASIKGTYPPDDRVRFELEQRLNGPSLETSAN